MRGTKVVYVCKEIAKNILPYSLYLRVSKIAKRYIEKTREPISPDILAAHFEEKDITPDQPLPLIYEDTQLVLTPDFFGQNEIGESKKFQKKSVEIVICCAFMGRHRILRQIVAETFSSKHSQNLSWVLVGSTSEDLDFIRDLASKFNRVSGFAAKIQPLGKKWQSAVKLAQKLYDHQLLAITGSDDFLSKKLIDHVLEQYRDHKKKIEDNRLLPALYCSMEWLVVQKDQKHEFWGQIFRCNYKPETANQPLGAGRFYVKDFLESVNYFIFNSKKSRLLDDDGFISLAESAGLVEYISVEEGPVISVKGDWAQLNPVDALLKADTVEIKEYSFSGFELMKTALSESSINYLFKEL